MKETTTSESRFSKKPTERYQWPLAAAVACWIAALLIGERKRNATAIRTASLALLIFCSALPARAAEVQKPQSLFAKADYAGAAKAFEEQRAKRQVPELDYNLGISAYKAGELDKAAEALSGALGSGNEALQPKAAFGLANVLARRGVKQEKKEDKIADWKNAIQHYERTLALEPGHGDATHNRDLLKKLLDDLEKKDKPEEKKDEEKKEQDKKNEENKDGEQSNSGDGKSDQQKEQEKKEAGKKDGENKDGQQKDAQQKDAQSQDSKKEEGEKKDGEQKDGKSQDGKNENGDKKDGQQKSGEQKEKSDKPGDKPAQAQPQNEGEKKQGELKSANQQEGAEDKKNQQAAEVAEEMAAAAEGRMTAKDAKQLLDSMRNTERRVRLLDPRQEIQNQSKPRPEKNW